MYINMGSPFNSIQQYYENNGGDDILYLLKLVLSDFSPLKDGAKTIHNTVSQKVMDMFR